MSLGKPVHRQGLFELLTDLLGDAGKLSFPAFDDPLGFGQAYRQVIELAGGKELFGERILVFVADLGQGVAHEMG